MNRRMLPIFGTLISWSIFCLGAAAEYQRQGGALLCFLLIVAAGAPWIAAYFIARRSRKWLPRLEARMHEHAAFVDALPQKYLWLWIALAAGVGLFLELVVIRFHGCCFQLFAFFKNFSLLSCFLGLGIGYADAAENPTLFTPLVLPMLAVQGFYCIRCDSAESSRCCTIQSPSTSAA